MPPTNFFKKKSAGEDIEMDDLESILDDALALNMPAVLSELALPLSP